MPEQTPAPPAAQAPSAVPAPAAPAPTPPAADDGYDPGWMAKLDPRRKADVEEFYKSRPVHKELDAAKGELARRQSWGNLQRAEIEQMTDAQASLDEVRSAYVAAGLVDAEDAKEARTPRELRLMAKRGVAKPAASSAANGNSSQNEFHAAMDAWARERGIAPKQARTDTLPDGAGVPAAEPITADNIDQKFNNGEVSRDVYRAFIADGTLPKR